MSEKLFMTDDERARAPRLPFKDDPDWHRMRMTATTSILFTFRAGWRINVEAVLRYSHWKYTIWHPAARVCVHVSTADDLESAKSQADTWAHSHDYWTWREPGGWG